MCLLNWSLQISINMEQNNLRHISNHKWHLKYRSVMLTLSNYAMDWVFCHLENYLTKFRNFVSGNQILIFSKSVVHNQRKIIWKFLYKLSHVNCAGKVGVCMNFLKSRTNLFSFFCFFFPSNLQNQVILPKQIKGQLNARQHNLIYAIKRWHEFETWIWNLNLNLKPEK